MGLNIILNGQPKNFPELGSRAALSEVVDQLQLKPDRIAIELNGDIARRETWGEVQVSDGDRLELVHFVGGGMDSRCE